MPDARYQLPGIRYRGIGLLLILLLALGLRLYRLDAQSLWNDEGTSAAVAGRSLATIARDAAQDIHPPLYYWLLHGWLRLTGDSEFALRSLSAFLGVLLAALTYALGHRLIGPWAGLAAAFLAAVHPFQVYYSQEARMYMLLAALTAGAMLALANLSLSRSKFSAQSRPGSSGSFPRSAWERKKGAPRYPGPAATPARILDLPSLVALTLLETAGLYTHYSFLFVILVLNLAFAFHLWRGRTPGLLGRWLASQTVVLLLYLPWLPTAYRQLTTWPSPTQATPFFAALADTWRWLVFGPTIEIEQVIVFLLLAALLALWGAWRMWKSAPQKKWAAALLLLWLGLPLVLMFALGLHRESYLKFLLVAAPALTLLLARGLLPAPRYLLSLTLAALLLLPTARALHNYYTDPAYARDDYRGIAAYIEAVGRPGDMDQASRDIYQASRDAVLLNAPGQQEVFGYYYDGPLPVYPLPESRPLDRTVTEAALTELAQLGGRVFAVLWATDESDPQRFIEGWLDSHAYKALDSWYGNVRLVVYAVPEQTPDAPDHTLNIPLQSAESGARERVTLLGYSLLGDRLAAGDIAQITLFWQAAQTPTQRYKVFLHLLDEGNHIVGQRDAEPGGGAKLTTLWSPGEVVADNHGLPVHPATPPGDYRLEVGLYDAESGQRLLTPEGEGQIWLEPLRLERPAAPPPTVALGMQRPANAEFGELTLLGYDVYELGFAHQPDAPLRPGDVLHLNLYWRAETQPGGDWQLAVDLVGAGQHYVEGFIAEPVGGYPTSRWRADDVWRGQFNLTIPGHARPGRYRLHIQPIAPDGSAPAPFETTPLTVHP